LQGLLFRTGAVLFAPFFCILDVNIIIGYLAIAGYLAFAKLINIKFLLILRLSKMGFLIAIKLISIGFSLKLISVKILQGLLYCADKLATFFASGILIPVCLILLTLFILAFISLILLNLAFPSLFI
jgi:hypothetical protein